MEGQRGICNIKFPHFKLIIQEKGLGRQEKPFYILEATPHTPAAEPLPVENGG
jgi:hypothetical protein